MLLFVFQFYPVCNFGEFIHFRRDTVRSERGKGVPSLFVTYRKKGGMQLVRIKSK